MNRVQIYPMVALCGEMVYNRKPPTPEYATNAKALLMMTAAHESGGFHYRRQGGYSPYSTSGAFGLFQLEWISISSSLDYLDRRTELKDHCLEYLEPYGFHNAILDRRAKGAILNILQQPAGDALGCMFARVHYLPKRGKIPDTLEGMAKYAKKYYNTEAGKATAEKYLDAYRRWVECDDSE